jgi:hypothetical protein
VLPICTYILLVSIAMRWKLVLSVNLTEIDHSSQLLSLLPSPRDSCICKFSGTVHKCFFLRQYFLVFLRPSYCHPVISHLFVADLLGAFLHSDFTQHSCWTWITLSVSKIFLLKHMLFYCVQHCSMMPLGTTHTLMTFRIGDITYNVTVTCFSK